MKYFKTLKDAINSDWSYYSQDQDKSWDTLTVVAISSAENENIDDYTYQECDMFVKDDVSGAVYRHSEKGWICVWKNA